MEHLLLQPVSRVLENVHRKLGILSACEVLPRKSEPMSGVGVHPEEAPAGQGRGPAEPRSQGGKSSCCIENKALAGRVTAFSSLSWKLGSNYWFFIASHTA
ncbi:unnamed protein product [Rangifer tarandus platyrhynchus]|uniref:Uncharacterized protein n=1 Tax=Rangifer tarandus platyrhynchus TaxID=3082113 RepID=A0AC60A724_RANTA